LPFVLATIQDGATVYADEASHWDDVERKFLTKRINHSVEYSTPEACTNQAESFFSRFRRAEVGIHHSIAGPIWSPMPPKWHGAKTTAASAMAVSF
jgi:hypothetical protein